MHLYDVTYPHQAAMDVGVGRAYLDHLCGSLGRHGLAVARNTTWDHHVLYHWEGDWLASAALPERASFAYRAGPAWEAAEERQLAAERAAKPLHVCEVTITGPVMVSGGHLGARLLAVDRRTLVEAARQEDPALRAAYADLLAQAVALRPSFRPDEYR